MRRLLLFTPCMLLLLACGGSVRAPASGAAAVVSPTPQPTTISWSFWGDAQEASIDQRIIGLFESEHPEIHVEARWAPYASYLDALAQWRADGQAPDVSFLYDVPVFASQGLLADLTPLIAEHAYDVGDFYPNLLDQFRYQGDLFGLPRDNDTKV
ncbi:MAG TPA: ABC transporter substrate-binding protein, partial [Dehalococcoidia bacterium]|nr:ABC transporter substrate-binding protein [Dehalococcoidia bacterium]